MMAIELYYSPYCDACAKPDVRAAAESPGVTVKDVTEHLAEAVRHGIVQPPALVVDGQLVAQGSATIRKLKELVGEVEQCAPIR